MPNNTVRADGIAMPAASHMNRRNALAITATGITAALTGLAVKGAEAKAPASELPALITAHSAAFTEFLRAVDIESDYDEKGRGTPGYEKADSAFYAASDAEQEALDALLSYRCASMSELAMKADYIAKAMAGCVMSVRQVGLLMASMRWMDG